VNDDLKYDRAGHDAVVMPFMGKIVYVSMTFQKQKFLYPVEK